MLYPLVCCIFWISHINDILQYFFFFSHHYFLNLNAPKSHLGDLVKNANSGSVDLGWSLRLCLSNKLPGAAGGLKPHFIYFCFLGPHWWHMEVPRLGVQLELQLCWPMPQPHQQGIRAMSATYTPAHGNPGSLTH